MGRTRRRSRTDPAAVDATLAEWRAKGLDFTERGAVVPAAAVGLPVMLPPDRRLDASEPEFQAEVLKYATPRDWLHYHTFDSRRSAPGFPDLVLVRGRHVIWAELKAEGGEVRPAQRVWLAALRAAGQVVFEWRPRDWPEIEAVLA